MPAPVFALCEPDDRGEDKQAKYKDTERAQRAYDKNVQRLHYRLYGAFVWRWLPWHQPQGANAPDRLIDSPITRPPRWLAVPLTGFAYQKLPSS